MSLLLIVDMKECKVSLFFSSLESLDHKYGGKLTGKSDANKIAFKRKSVTSVYPINLLKYLPEK